MEILDRFYLYAKDTVRGRHSVRDLLLYERKLYNETTSRHPYRLDTVFCMSLLGQFEGLSENGGDERIAEKLMEEFIGVMEGCGVYRVPGVLSYYLYPRVFDEVDEKILQIASQVSEETHPLTRDEFCFLREVLHGDAAQTIPRLLTETVAAYLCAEYNGCHHSGNLLPHWLERAEGAPIYLHMNWSPGHFQTVIL